MQFFWIPIEVKEDFDLIADEVDDSYFDLDHVCEKLKSYMSSNVAGVLVETDYVDKDYRSTFYHYYAKKGLAYPPNCIRLHFFAAGVRLAESLTLQVEKGEVADRYYGFVVVRPTRNAPIGRSIVSAAAIDNFDGKLITAKYVVHLLGERLEIKGFPFMEQHSDISVCAHAACWSIMRHHSTRYKRYPELLLYDVTKLAVPHDPGGLSPSRGLDPESAARVFSLSGLFPDTYSLTTEGHWTLFRRLLAYIESGMPVFAMKEKHAFAVVGHGPPDLELLEDEDFSPCAYWWSAVNSLLVVDDNFFPYRRVGSLDTETDYLLSDIVGFIVPLPDKVYMPADSLEIYVEDQLRSPPHGLDFSHVKRPVVRYFLTTSSSLRKYIKDQASLLDVALSTRLQTLVLPQFVWVAEVADLTERKAGRSNLLFLLDATAGPHDEWPFFLLHDRNRAMIYDRAHDNELVEITLDVPLAYWTPFDLNLR
jgi:hypothetical protein